MGQLFIEGDLRVSGTVDGELEATGDIEITGRVNGAVTAYNRLVVGSAGSLIGGDVRVARLTVEDGATLTGKISMGKHAVETPKTVVVPEPEPVSVPVVAEVTPVAVERVKPQPGKVEAVKPQSVKPTLKPVQQKGKRR